MSLRDYCAMRRSARIALFTLLMALGIGLANGTVRCSVCGSAIPLEARR